jgi:prepilin-type N-terminal cleavage/methylation domain-containing protein
VKRYAAHPLEGQRGLTLAELLVALSIVAVISGIAVGMIRRGDGGLGAEANTRLVRSTLRYARNAARDAGAGAIVTFDPESQEIAVAPVELAANFHFEDEFGSQRRRLELSGQLVDEGHLGRGLALSSGLVDLGLLGETPVQGFRVSFWLRPEDLDKAGRVLERENTFSLSLDADGSLRVRIRVGEQGEAIQLETRPGLMTVGRWRRVDFAYDRAAITLAVDGVQQLRKPEARVLFRDKKARLLLGSGGVSATMDTLRYWVVSEGETRRLGSGVEIEASGPITVAFDGEGRLNPAVHSGPVEIALRFPSEEPEGILQTLRVEKSGVVR